MEEVCNNCEHFADETVSGSSYAWGYCTKSTCSAAADGKKERGTLTWPDKTCSDFKPRQKLDNNPRSAPKGGKFLKQDCGQFG